VDVESGDSYATSTKVLMSVRDYVDAAFSTAGGRELPQRQQLYLAQTDLGVFPALVPDVSFATAAMPFGKALPPQLSVEQLAQQLVATKLWLGPAGTLSQCHRDPYDNILCQVFGTKRLRIFPPSARSLLYLHADPILRNTSRIRDVEHALEHAGKYATLCKIL